MKHLSAFIILLTICFFSQTTIAQEKIEIGTKHRLFSKKMNEEKDYWVYLPPSYNDTIYAPQKYPVVYFLDGSRHFHSITGIHDFLIKGPYGSLPEMIMVGIISKDRAKDYTPTKVNKPNSGLKNFPTSGDNSKFLNFIENELKPTINKKYRTSEFSIFIGHSFGGIAVLNALLEKPELFDAYISIDPSIWWDNAYFLKKGKEKLTKKQFNKKSLYLARADNLIQPKNNYTKLNKKNVAKHLEKIEKFHSLLKETSNLKLRWAFNFFKNEDHGTVSLPAEFKGLRFIFENYQAPIKSVAQNPEILASQFKTLSKKIGTQMKPSEARVDWIANYCIKKKLKKSAIKLLKMNVKWYPNSTHAKLTLDKVLQSK